MADVRTRFRYIGKPQNLKQHSGAITVASYADYDAKKVSVGFSFCSPLSHYVRKKGRLIAEGRLKKYPIILSFSTTPSDAINKFLCALIANNHALHPGIELLPAKAIKHFPLPFPWFQNYQLPDLTLRMISRGVVTSVRESY
jgi:hypothetical protein